MGRKLFSAAALLIAVVGLLGLTGLTCGGESLRGIIPMLLARSGVSEYHIQRYWSDGRFPQYYRCGQVCLLAMSLAGAAAWAWRERLCRGAVACGSRLPRLVVARPTDEVVVRGWPIDRYAGLALLAVGAGSILRDILTWPVRGDEATMYLTVCHSPLPLWAVAYISPNNHVEYASLVWAGHFIWGGDVAGMRVFSLAAWLLTAPLLSRISVELFGTRSWSLAAIAMTMPYSLVFGTLARGYALGMFWGLLSLLMVLRSRDIADALLAGCAAGLSLLAVPSMIYAVAIGCGLILWRVRDNRPRGASLAAAYLGSSIAVAAILYTPILLFSGAKAVFANEHVASHPMAEVAREYGSWLAREMGEIFASPIGLLALLAATVARTWGRGKGWTVMPALLILSVMFLPLLQRVLPPIRTFGFIAPLALMAWGGVPSRRVHLVYAGLALIGALVMILPGLEPSRRVAWDASDSARQAALAIEAEPGRTAQGTSLGPDFACLKFYLEQDRWPGTYWASGDPQADWVFDPRLGPDDVPGYEPSPVRGLFRASR